MGKYETHNGANRMVSFPLRHMEPHVMIVTVNTNGGVRALLSCGETEAARIIRALELLDEQEIGCKTPGGLR